MARPFILAEIPPGSGGRKLPSASGPPISRARRRCCRSRRCNSNCPARWPARSAIRPRAQAAPAIAPLVRSPRDETAAPTAAPPRAPTAVLCSVGVQAERPSVPMQARIRKCFMVFSKVQKYVHPPYWRPDLPFGKSRISAALRKPACGPFRPQAMARSPQPARAAATEASRMPRASVKCASGMVIGARKRTTLP